MPNDKSTNHDNNVLIGFDGLVPAVGALSEHFGFGRDPATNQSTGPRIIWVTVTPNAVVSAPTGSIALGSNGVVYTNTSVLPGGTAWTVVSTAAAPAAADFAEIFGLTAGTGMAGTDYAGTVAVKTAAGTGRVPFPQTGAINGASIARNDANSLLLAAGTYEVSFHVHTTEPGQLQLELNGVDLAPTCFSDLNPTAGGHPIGGTAIIVVPAGPALVLAVVNCAGNAAALTITPANGSQTHANAQTLVVKKLA